MNAMQAIQACSETSSMIVKSYIGDLEDADLFVRPGEGCNHLAWQLGHLISAECRLIGARATEAVSFCYLLPSEVSGTDTDCVWPARPRPSPVWGRSIRSDEEHEVFKSGSGGCL